MCNKIDTQFLRLIRKLGIFLLFVIVVDKGDIAMGLIPLPEFSFKDF